MKRYVSFVVLAVVGVLGFGALGCHGQLPPTNRVVNLSWSTPAAGSGWAGCGSGQPVCTYVISRAPASGGICPATTGTAYTPLNASSPATGLTYTDAAAGGLTVCYVAQTLQSGAVSIASNSTGPLTVPGNPLAPALGAGTVATGKQTLFPDSHPFELSAIRYTALPAPASNLQLQAKIAPSN